MYRHLSMSALFAALAASAPYASAEQTPGLHMELQADPARPSDSTANLPSAIGSQTTLPSGAVTGLGHAQAPELKAFTYGDPGGLQQRARQREEATASTAGEDRAVPGEGRSVAD
jgi:hypothetical protein